MGATFNADVHWGDRKDQFLARDVSATLTNIIHFRQFQETDRRNPKLSYLVFGESEDLFLAHFIAVPPDFDQIVAVRVVEGSPPRPRTKLIVSRRDGRTTRLRRKGEVVAGELVGITGPGSDAARAYPSLTSGHERGSSRRSRIKLRVIAERYFSEIDEES